MIRLLTLAVAVVVMSGCTVFNAFVKVTGGDPFGLDPILKPIKRSCDPLQTREVGWDEEHEIGGAVALGLSQQAGGVFIEVSPTFKDEPALSPEKWKDSHVVAPTGERADLTAYLNRLARYLAQFSDRPTLPWTVAVLDSPSPNAFSAPGGYIFVTTGLLKKTQNEAQLAGVIAHEIGHINARDSINAYKQGKSDACYGVMALIEIYKKTPTIDGPVLAILPESIRKVATALTPKERDAVAREWRAAAEAKEFNPGSNSEAFVGALTDAVVWIINHTGYAKETELRADASANKILTYAGYDRSQLQAIINRLPDGGGISPHPSNRERTEALNKLQQDPAEKAFAGTAAPDNSEALKAARK